MPEIRRQTPPAPSRITNNQTQNSKSSGGMSAWDLAEFYKVLLYGESRTGKTTLWATFPGPILALICSGSTQPGELRSINTPEYRKKITAPIVSSCKQFLEEISKADKYQTVVVDHGSGLQDLTIKEIKGLEDILVSKYKVAGKGESWAEVSQKEWGSSAIMCKELFRAVLSLQKNVVIVAQQRIFESESDGEVIAPTVGAALSPSVTGWLNPACDYVVQTFIRPKIVTTTTTINNKDIETKRRGEGVEYCLRCAPHDVYMTKFRIPKGKPLPPVIVDPTYEKIAKLITG